MYNNHNQYIIEKFLKEYDDYLKDRKKANPSGVYFIKPDNII